MSKKSNKGATLVWFGKSGYKFRYMRGLYPQEVLITHGRNDLTAEQWAGVQKAACVQKSNRFGDVIELNLIQSFVDQQLLQIFEGGDAPAVTPLASPPKPMAEAAAKGVPLNTLLEP